MNPNHEEKTPDVKDVGGISRRMIKIEPPSFAMKMLNIDGTLYYGEVRIDRNQSVYIAEGLPHLIIEEEIQEEKDMSV